MNKSRLYTATINICIDIIKYRQDGNYSESELSDEMKPNFKVDKNCLLYKLEDGVYLDITDGIGNPAYIYDRDYLEKLGILYYTYPKRNNGKYVDVDTLEKFYKLPGITTEGSARRRYHK